MTFEEIFVGERNRSMGVLATSLDADLSRTIASRLDLPGQKPNGYDLKSYIFGIQESGYYIFARISPDHTAERGGMVFGHALAISIEKLSVLSDLKPVFAYLRASRPANPVAQNRELRANGFIETSPPGAICDILVDAGLRPAVTTEADWVENWVIRIWPKLTPTMRQELRFGLIFSAEDSAALSLHLAVVPKRTLPQWNSDCCFRTKDAAEVSAKTLQGLALSTTSSIPVQSFAVELGLRDVGFTQFNHLSQAAEFFEQENDFQKALAASRLVGSLQPDLRHGQSVRFTLGERIFESPGPSSGKECLALRNLNTEIFGKVPDLSRRFEVAITRGLTGNIEQASIRDCIEAAFTEGQATPEWSQSLKKALLTADALIEPVSSALSELIEKDGQTLEKALPALSADRFDASLMNLLSKSGKKIPPKSRSLLASNAFYQSEAVALKAECNGDSEAALKVAYERDVQHYGDFAIEYLLNDMKPAAIIKSAMTFDHVKIKNAATTCALMDPSLLNKRLGKNKQALDIWENALEQSLDSWAIEDSLEKVQNRILKMHSQSPLSANLMKLLMKSAAGNWSQHPQRHEVWNRLRGSANEHALNATAKGWLTDFTNGVASATSLILETPLIEKLTSIGMKQEFVLGLTSQPLSHTISLFSSNSQLSENVLIESLKQRFALKEILTLSDSQSLGHLLVARNWRSLTTEIYKLVGKNNSLRPVLQIAVEHLSYLKRFMLGLSKPTTGQLKEALIEISSELYPTGIREKDIWVRAGGDISDICVDREGKRQWREAITMVSSGGAGLGEGNFLTSMLEDFPTNAQLLYLKRAFAE